MKSLKTICIAVLLFLIVVACEKEEPVPEYSLIELELKEFVQKNNISKCTIREFQNGASWEPVQNSSFKFSNGFIITYHFYFNAEFNYNLQYLYSYRKESGNVLYLEFVKF